jgi:hypothetical protein
VGCYSGIEGGGSRESEVGSRKSGVGSRESGVGSPKFNESRFPGVITTWKTLMN